MLADESFDLGELAPSVTSGGRLLHQRIEPVRCLSAAAAFDADMPALEAVVHHDEQGVLPDLQKCRHTGDLAGGGAPGIRGPSPGRNVAPAAARPTVATSRS